MSNPTVTVTVPPVKTEVFFHCAVCEKTACPRPDNWLSFSVSVDRHQQEIILCPDCKTFLQAFIEDGKKPTSSTYSSRTEYKTFQCAFCLKEFRRCVFPLMQALAAGQNPWTGFAFITIQGTGYGSGHANQHFLCCPECVKTKLATTAG